MGIDFLGGCTLPPPLKILMKIQVYTINSDVLGVSAPHCVPKDVRLRIQAEFLMTFVQNPFMGYTNQISYLINMTDVLWSSFSGLNCNGTFALERGAIIIEIASGEVRTPIAASNDDVTSESGLSNKYYKIQTKIDYYFLKC
jgi:hypothetical protein